MILYDTQFWKEQLGNLPGLQAQLLMAPELRKEELIKLDSSIQPHQSAVLVLIYKDADTLKLLLTLRSKDLKKHSGQVSFPGGREDNSDIDLQQTALREAWEEVGLDKNHVEIIGWLSPLIIPVTGFNVHPLVAACAYKPELQINTDEVEKVVEVNIEDLANDNNIKVKAFGTRNSNFTINAPYFDINGVEIWGATAMMISELLVVLFPSLNFGKTIHNNFSTSNKKYEGS